MNRLSSLANAGRILAEHFLEHKSYHESPRAVTRSALLWIKEISAALRAEINAEKSDVKAMSEAIDALDLLLEVVTIINEEKAK